MIYWLFFRFSQRVCLFLLLLRRRFCGSGHAFSFLHTA